MTGMRGVRGETGVQDLRMCNRAKQGYNWVKQGCNMVTEGVTGLKQHLTV